MNHLKVNTNGITKRVDDNDDDGYDDHDSNDVHDDDANDIIMLMMMIMMKSPKVVKYYTYSVRANSGIHRHRVNDQEPARMKLQEGRPF